MRIRSNSGAVLRMTMVGLALFSGCTDDPDMAPGPGNTSAGREKTGTAVTVPTPASGPGSDTRSKSVTEPSGTGSSTGAKSSAGDKVPDPG